MTARCLDCSARFNPREAYEIRCFRCWKAWKIARGEYRPHPAPPPDPSLPVVAEWREMLPRLLMLAHPDRHANSPMATRATQWLIAQRARLTA